jgi:2-polyprenyl-6-methoxyphenol hydroxylase-like FAD-dependent oxidoreductase
MSTPSNTSTTNPSTGIRVIVIGAGFGGLTAAIECYQRGHSVTLLEAFPELKPLGDIITFGSNSARIFSRWPGVLEQINSAIVHCDGIEFKTFHGKYLLKQLWKDEPAWGETFNGHRGEIHEIIFNHAKSLGIDIRLNHKVVDCFESDTEAGVIVENGQIFTGDVVLAADGVHSTARKILLKYDDHPRDSGYSVYRSWFDSTELAKNPLIAPLVNNGDTYSAWIGTYFSFDLDQARKTKQCYSTGPNAHFLALSWKGGKQFVWICMHKV